MKAVRGRLHELLNTDNLNVTGESFDYGPWRFLPTYDLSFTAAYFDEGGLYAYGRQVEAVLWNLVRLAECLVPLGEEALLQDALAAFVPSYQAAFRAQLLWRLGLTPRGIDADEALAAAIVTFLEDARLPFDRFFFDGYGGEARVAQALAGPFAQAYAGPGFAAVRAAWATYTPARPERLTDPYLSRTGPVTVLITDVEAVWDAIAREDDWGPFERLVGDIRELGRFLGAP